MSRGGSSGNGKRKGKGKGVSNNEKRKKTVRIANVVAIYTITSDGKGEDIRDENIGGQEATEKSDRVESDDRFEDPEEVSDEVLAGSDSVDIF